VHAHNWLVHSFLPLKTASRAKLVLSLHDYSLVCVKKRLMYQGAPCAGPGLIKCLRCAADHYGAAKGVPIALANWAMSPLERRAVDWYLPVSRAVAAGNAVSADQSDVVPNFVPDDVTDLRGDPPAELSHLPSGDFLMFAGDLTRDKGVHVLLAAYAGLRDAPPLVLIGRPCADTPTSLPPGVRVLHSWPRAAVMWAWRRCLLALVPSVWPEPGASVALEAMASGRPVIGSAIGGLPELVADGKTGILVRPGDPEALRAAIVRLLKDHDLREQMGRAAIAHAAGFRASTVAPLVERVYERVLLGTSDAPSGFDLMSGDSSPKEPAATEHAAKLETLL
jgi:glycosyltransferase involved in cell wall biosynthesis